ncbi:ProQ/FinO family protein [Salmonella enterica]|uniref:ProQ/FinO family protein n=1 Tax=Salmonella enterica TaxID=28901 RepID=UPI0012F26C3A|nr:prop effector [Salmonella enterica]EBQ9004519.1 prop effector [Salmonella enterica subsp. enterica serovar Blockley]ECS7526339.1 prop effector [Salmonella enterica]ECW2125707.1 prop effector [Salmonella enterica]
MTKDAINNASPAQGAGAKRIRPGGLTRAQWKKRKRVQKIAEFWPKLFDINNPKPLKLNIMQDMEKDIQLRGLDMGIGSVRVALGAYTSHAKYIRCVSAGGARYDLNGEPCGEVTEAAARNARERFKNLETKLKANRNKSVNDRGGKQETGSATDGR